jgi:hypothetical protein
MQHVYLASAITSDSVPQRTDISGMNDEHRDQ